MVFERSPIARNRWLALALILLLTSLTASCSQRLERSRLEDRATIEQDLMVSSGTATARGQMNLSAPTKQIESSVSTSLDTTGDVQGGAADEGSRSFLESLATEDWQDLPIIPELGDHAKEIYRKGIEAGNDPTAFAKVGDCQNVPSMFLSIFDHPGYYSLGEEYDYLQDTIDWYQGSFSRESEAVRRGFNAASVVSPVWADPEDCEQGETPLECEIRINNPSIALISLETWWAGNPENYEKYVRQIIEGLLEENVLPIIATKADNLEGDHLINRILVGLSMEYQIPVWNFWRAVQPLPGNGLLEDRFHLTFDDNHFDDPYAMQAAWPWRNLTALQVLDKIRSELVLQN